LAAPFTVRTARLELIPGTVAATRAEIDDRARFAELLGVAPLVDWPPPLNDADSMAYSAAMLAAHPDRVGFGVWYFVLLEGEQRTLIGNGGFHGPPDDTGTLEIGYSLLEPYQRQGYGTEIVAALVDWAFAQPGAQRLIAETLPELIGSIRVLEKNGFHHLGEGSEPGVIRLERARPRR
jgi:ribosomal-protein-alanine N-acetyltransferase